MKKGELDLSTYAFNFQGGKLNEVFAVEFGQFEVILKMLNNFKLHINSKWNV